MPTLQGGESTNEEMCLTFPIYYPRATDGSALIQCISLPNAEENSDSSFAQFVTYLSE